MAAALADEISAVVSTWPSFERWSIGMQVVRSAGSIGANIAEATGRWHEADQRRFLVIARGSLYETEHWLLRAQAAGATTGRLHPQLDELARALNGLMKKPTPR